VVRIINYYNSDKINDIILVIITIVISSNNDGNNITVLITLMSLTTASRAAGLPRYH